MEVLHISRTYAGLYEGHPHEELNKQIMASARGTAEIVFPDWPVYMVAPTITTRRMEMRERTYEYPRLPSFECIGQFTGSQTNDDEYDGPSCCGRIDDIVDRSPEWRPNGASPCE
jgi:hypothetical protein